MEHRFEDFAAAVEQAEAAWLEGRLKAALVNDNLVTRLGEEVTQKYRRLLGLNGRAAPFRRGAVQTLLKRMERELGEPKLRFEAAAVMKAHALTTQPMLSGLRVKWAGGETFLRLDQVISMKFWGIGFTVADDEANRMMSARILKLAKSRFIGELRDLETIETRNGALIPPDAEILSAGSGLLFERLMCDLLNELELSAWPAPLAEDVLEKTDLRFQHSSLKRKRGARLQVTQTMDEDRHVLKLERIRHVEEFVILSPRSLAQALASPEGAQLLSRAEIQELWGMCRAPAGVDEVAAYIRMTLLRATSQAQEHPHGPVPAVPEVLRRLVRAFVLREANRSTANLRWRELLG